MIKANTLRDKIVDLALLQLNKEYVYNAHGSDNFDCAGLLWYVYHEILNIDIYDNGYGLSTTTKIMTNDYGKLTLFDELDEYKDLKLINKGDILFFHRQSLNCFEPDENNKYPGHCGIYLGNNKFIHCSKTKRKVLINSFNNKY